MSLIELQIEPFNVMLEDQFDSSFKILHAQLQFHNIQFIDKFGKRGDFAEREVELSPGKKSKIRVFPIPSDGNCLFGAILHQLFFLEVGCNEYVQRLDELRKKVVTHIKANLKKFEQNLLGRIHDKRVNNGTTKLKIVNVEEECIRFLDNHLSKDRYWGGAETIAAAGELFKVNIIIFNECAGVRFANSFNPSHKDVITLAHRASSAGMNPNHFESVLHLSDYTLNECTAILISKYTKTCSIQNLPSAINVE